MADFVNVSDRVMKGKRTAQISVVKILAKLPEDFELVYFDPDAKQEESWIFVRRAGGTYFVSTVQRGYNRNYRQISADGVRASFMSSPFIQKLPPEGIASLTIQRIPDHQRDWHFLGHDNTTVEPN